MSKTTFPRIAVLGAGPIGLEAALYARSAGCNVTIYERTHPGHHVERWGFIKMFTPFGMNVTSLGRQAILRMQPSRELPADTDLLTGREFRESYLIPLAESTQLKDYLHNDSRVLAIGRTGWRKQETESDSRQPLPPFRLLIRTAQGQERLETADVILDCTGTFGMPNWVGDGGIPAVGEVTARPQISYWPEDVVGARRAHYANKSIVVIGGGHSAAGTIADLATLAETEQSTWTIWLTNGPKTQPLPRWPADPLRERDRLAARVNHLAARCDANLEYHPQTQIDELVHHGQDQGFRVAGRVNGKPITWEVERVIALVGYRPDMTFCSELRVADPSGQVETSEPGYYILGAKSRGRNSDFMMRDGHAQIQKLMARVLGQSRLDLYAANRAA